MAHPYLTIAEEPHRENLSPGKIGEDDPPISTLPREVIRPVTWRNVVSLLCISLLAFLAVNVAADTYLSRYTPNRGNWLIQEKWKLLDEVRQAYDWVILGDSSCNQGLDPEVWDSKFGSNSLNLCTIGDMLLLDDVWMLQSLISRDLAPKSVLIIHVYDVWKRDPNPILLGQVPKRRIWSSSDPRIELNLKDAVKEFISRYLPVVSQNAALRSSLISPMKWFRQQFSLSPRGFMAVLEANPERVDRDADDHLRTTRKRCFEISEMNKAALAEIRRISENYGIDVFVVPSPIFDGLLDSEEFVAHIENMHMQLNEWSESGSRLYYVPELVPFPRTTMENADHLTADAARSYTYRVGTLVRGLMDSKK